MSIPDQRRTMLTRIFGQSAETGRRSIAEREAGSTDHFASDARSATVPPVSLGGRTAREPSLLGYSRPKLPGDAPSGGDTRPQSDAAPLPGGDAIRQSDLRISIHNGILSQFDAVHRLVNAADRLNFTKSRLPSDPADARLAISKLLAKPDCHAAYVKASDKHRSYGVVGYFIMYGEVLQHFVFSSDVLHLRIEQAIYQLLGYPGIVVVGHVAADLKKERIVDWAMVVDDAGRARTDEANRPTSRADSGQPSPPVRRNLLPAPQLLAGQGWATLGDAQARANAHEAPTFAGSCVMEHTLPLQPKGGDGFVFGCHLPSGLVSGEVYTASASIWIPRDFRGSHVAILFVGYRYEVLAAASLSRRGEWQNIQASARIPTGASNAFPALSVVGSPGDKIYSAGWKVEQAAESSADVGAPVGTATGR